MPILAFTIVAAEPICSVLVWSLEDSRRVHRPCRYLAGAFVSVSFGYPGRRDMVVILELQRQICHLLRQLALLVNVVLNRLAHTKAMGSLPRSMGTTLVDGGHQ